VTPRLAGTFVAGGLAYAWRNYVPIHPMLAIAAIIGAMLSVSTSFAAYAVFGAIAYASLVIAYAPSLDVPAFRRLGDYSYGIYVFAFPTQQAIASALGPMPPLLLFGLAYPVVFALAFASWHAIEAPALRFKRKTSG
jgi:peptidoglycan/LPS O-acetylase OafA/YrhL